MKRLIISAPFGNYIQPDGATPTLGTFTLHRRRGRVQRIIRTVRWYPRIGAWVNKIGLRNPGIEWLAERAKAGRVDLSDKIVSIHGFEDDEWARLLDTLVPLSPMAIELNISCPNVGHISWPTDLFSRSMSMSGEGTTVIVKIPPVRYHRIIDDAAAAGVRTFHCCNTLPVPAGGLSGKPLLPVSLECIAEIRGRLGDAWSEYTIIGGGGITGEADIRAYAEAGASHVAIATKAFNPWYLVQDGALQRLATSAAQILDA